MICSSAKKRERQAVMKADAQIASKRNRLFDEDDKMSGSTDMAFFLPETGSVIDLASDDDQIASNQSAIFDDDATAQDKFNWMEEKKPICLGANEVKNSHMKSRAWKHFKLVESVYQLEDPDRLETSYTSECRYCKHVFKYTGSTSGMQRHLETHHREKLDARGIEAPAIKCDAAGQNELNNLIARFIISSGLSIGSVDQKPFKNLLSGLSRLLNIEFACPSKAQVQRKAIEDANVRKMMIRENLARASHIAVSINTWKCERINSKFFGLTAHYLSRDFKLQSVCLGLRQIAEYYTPAHIASFYNDWLTEFNILSKVNAVVGDVTSNSESVAKLMGNSGGIKFYPCFAHALDSIVKNALAKLQIDLDCNCDKELSEMHPVSQLMAKCRALVCRFSSNRLTSQLLAAQDGSIKDQSKKRVKLIIDQRSRWNSTYMMISRILRLAGPIKTVLQENHADRDSLLDEREMQLLDELSDVLGPFYLVTQKLCENKYVARSMILPYLEYLEQMMSEVGAKESPMIKSIKKELLAQIDLYRRTHDLNNTNASLLTVTFLDPHFKRLDKLGDLNPEEGVKRVRQYINENHLDVKEVEELADLDAASHKKLMRQKWLALLSTEKQYTTPNTLAQEIQDYVNFASVTETCAFYASHSQQYPKLTKVASEMLHVPANCVPAVRIFARAGYQVTDRRLELEPENLDHVMLLYDAEECEQIIDDNQEDDFMI